MYDSIIHEPVKLFPNIHLNCWIYNDVNMRFAPSLLSSSFSGIQY